MASSQEQSYFVAQQQQQQPLYPTTSSPQEQQTAAAAAAAAMSFNTKVSPSILLIIVILAVIFFVSGLLHLLVRFLLHPPSRRRDHAGAWDRDGGATAFQGQLRQLFHLHDAGVDQSFIDALPVFLYNSIISNSKPARHLDCAVCLCEFDPDDRLRLLPRCSHAFHVDCIDTWLLSHTTCPLCRACLLLPTSADRRSSPLLLVLESAAAESPDPSPPPPPPPLEEEEKVVTVKLGKFKSVEAGGGGEGTSSVAGSSDIGADSRRCFSMGSFAYVVDESSELRVPIRATPAKKKKSGDNKTSSSTKAKKTRAAISECDCESRREFEFELTTKPEIIAGFSSDGTAGGCEAACRSVDRSRRAFSFRFLRNVHVDSKGKSGRFPRRTVSEIGLVRRENEENGIGFRRGGGGEDSSDDRSFNSLDSQSNNNNNTLSFARKTLLWLMGGRQQQNKVVHSSLDPSHNV